MGQLLEWNKEFDEIEPGHRHFSHLFGLYPADLITKDKTPELFDAAKRSLELRLSQGGGHTGWSRSWVACLFARLGDGEKVWEHLEALISDFATNSLLDLCPPKIFKIEGLRARGGYSVNIEWKNGILQKAEIIPSKNRECTIKVYDKKYTIKDGNGHFVTCMKDGVNIKFDAKSGHKYLVFLSSEISDKL